MKKFILQSLTLFALLRCQAQSATPGTAFTYQGRLTDGGTPANGNYDLGFALFCDTCNDPCCAFTTNAVPVTNGLFTVQLDFGAAVFNGTAYWLQISARTNGASAFTQLSPRQALTPTPYALFASTAATANGVAAGGVSATQLNTGGAPAVGQVLAFNGAGLLWTNASAAAAAWTLNGNTGTTPGANFLGTSDNQPFELRVNGQRALRIEPNTNGSPNFVGGASFNQIDAGVVGATIAGGGGTDASGLSYTNRISSSIGVIGGGSGNTILSNTFGATIAGGTLNTIESVAFRSTIGGGAFNIVQAGAFHSTIAGGCQKHNPDKRKCIDHRRR